MSVHAFAVAIELVSGFLFVLFFIILATDRSAYNAFQHDAWICERLWHGGAPCYKTHCWQSQRLRCLTCY